MNGKTLSCGISIVALFWVMTMIPVSAQPTADSFGVNDASGDPGTQVTVSVNITNTSGGPILGIAFNIAYDKNVINITDVSRGDLTSNWNVIDFNNHFEGGTRLSLAGPFASALPNGSSGSVALLNFSVERTSDSIGYSYVTMSDIQLSDPEGNLGTAPARNGLFYVVGLPTPTPPPHGGDRWSEAEDTDGDGYSDINEIFAGTDQNDPNSYPGSDAPAITPMWIVPSPTVTTTPTPRPPPVASKLTWARIIGMSIALVIIIIVCCYYYIKRKQKSI